MNMFDLIVEATAIVANIAVAGTLIALLIQYSMTNKQAKEKDLSIHKRDLGNITITSVLENELKNKWNYSLELKNDSKHRVSSLYIVYANYYKGSEMRDMQVSVAYIPNLKKNENLKTLLPIAETRLKTNYLKVKIIAFCYTDYQGRVWSAVDGEINEILLNKDLLKTPFVKRSTIIIEPRNIFASSLKDLFKPDEISKRNGKVNLDVGILIWLSALIGPAQNPYDTVLLRKERAKNLMENPDYLDLKHFVPFTITHAGRSLKTVENEFLAYFEERRSAEINLREMSNIKLPPNILFLLEKYISLWHAHIEEKNPSLWTKITSFYADYDRLKIEEKNIRIEDILIETDAFVRKTKFIEANTVEEQISILYLKNFEESLTNEEIIGSLSFLEILEELRKDEYGVNKIRRRRSREKILNTSPEVEGESAPAEYQRMMNFIYGEIDILPFDYRLDTEWAIKNKDKLFWLHELGEQIQNWKHVYWDELYQRPNLKWKIIFLLKEPYKKIYPLLIKHKLLRKKISAVKINKSY